MRAARAAAEREWDAVRGDAHRPRPRRRVRLAPSRPDPTYSTRGRFEYLARGRRRPRSGTRAFVREDDRGDVRIFVDHGFQWDGASNVWLTRARASFVVQAGPAFDVRPRTTLARVFGYQGGVSCGDPCFDYFFAV